MPAGTVRSGSVPRAFLSIQRRSTRLALAPIVDSILLDISDGVLDLVAVVLSKERQADSGGLVPELVQVVRGCLRRTETALPDRRAVCTQIHAIAPVRHCRLQPETQSMPGPRLQPRSPGGRAGTSGSPSRSGRAQVSFRPPAFIVFGPSLSRREESPRRELPASVISRHSAILAPAVNEELAFLAARAKRHFRSQGHIHYTAASRSPSTSAWMVSHRAQMSDRKLSSRQRPHT